MTACLDVLDASASAARIERTSPLAGTARTSPEDAIRVDAASANRRMLQAWAMLGRMDLERGLALVQGLIPPNDASVGELHLLRATALAFSDQAEASGVLVNDALRRFGADGAHPVAMLLTRLADWKRRDLPAFGELSRPPANTSSRRREALFALLHLSMESAVEAEQLRLTSAERLAAEALALSSRCFGPEFSGSRFAASLQAQLLYEQDRIDEADRLIRDRLALNGAHGGVEGALASYSVGARIAVVRGQTAYAILLLREAEELGRQRGWTRLVARSLAERVHILLEVHRQDEARDCLAHLEAFSCARADIENDSHAASQLAIARTRLSLCTTPDDETVQAARRLLDASRQRGERRQSVELQALLACVLLALNRVDEARFEATQALGIGAATGLYRTILDGGKAIHGLLSWLDQSTPNGVKTMGELRPYLRSLVAALGERVDAPTSARSRHRSGESLSARERHIVRLISQGMSNKRIAKELGIAPETVKSHAKHILLKLAARTRVEAVSRAMSLGML